jgi:hypothetical protein
MAEAAVGLELRMLNTGELRGLRLSTFGSEIRRMMGYGMESSAALTATTDDEIAACLGRVAHRGRAEHKKSPDARPGLSGVFQ